MSFKYFILSLLLLFVVLMVAVKSYETWTQPIGFSPEPQETVKKPTAKAKNPPAVGTNKEPASLQSFIVISEKNIFSPQRKDFPILTVEKSIPVTRPEVILYGVTIAGDFQAALITSPGRPLRKGEREAMTLEIGEKIGEYKLAKIQSDRITIESNEDSFEVLLYDPRKPKQRKVVKTEVKPATIISTQPAPAPPGRPAASPATARPPASVKKAPPAASVEKPRESQQQQVAPPTPTPVPRPIPPLSQRGRGTPAYPPAAPSAGAPGQSTQ